MDAFCLSLPPPALTKSYPTPIALTKTLGIPKFKIQSGFHFKNPLCYRPPFSSSSHSSSSCLQHCPVPLQKVLPLVATIAIILWSDPAMAGILSGMPGIESVPGPQLPSFEPLNRFNEENQKKYAEFDARFKSSPILKQLLERSKLNKEKMRNELKTHQIGNKIGKLTKLLTFRSVIWNKQLVQNKYCLRGAEWGIGECSTVGMTEAEKNEFIAKLKQKIEVQN